MGQVSWARSASRAAREKTEKGERDNDRNCYPGGDLGEQHDDILCPLKAFTAFYQLLYSLVETVSLLYTHAKSAFFSLHEVGIK